MAVTFRAVNTPVGGTTATITPAPPAGIAAGDLMLMQISSNLNVTPTPPSGWVFVDAETGGTGNISVYSRTATGSEPGTYTVTRVGAENYCAGIVAWTSDAGKALYVDANANRANTASTNRVFAGVTTTKASAGLNCFANLDSAVSSTADAAMLEKWDVLVGLGNQIYLMTQVLTSAGATGTRTATGGSTAATRTVTVAVAERLVPDADPSSLLATAVSTSQIDITFNQSSSNETGFEVWTSTDGSSFSLLTTLAANTTTYSHTSLSEHTRHWYKVRAVNADGYSGYSNTSDTYTLLVAPTSLVATANGSTTVDLTWTNASGAEDSIRVEQSSNGTSGWAEIYSTASNAVSYSVTGLPDNTTRYWRVRSAAGSDRSTYSNIASATTDDALAAPSSLTLTVLSLRRIKCDWTGNNSDETSTQIERSPNGSTGWVLVGTVGAGVVTFTDTGLTPNVTYYYRVRDVKA